MPTVKRWALIIVESLPQGPVQSLEPSKHLITIIQIEVDFLYDSFSAAAGHLSPKEDLGQESNNQMSKICQMENINKWSEISIFDRDAIIRKISLSLSPFKRW